MKKIFFVLALICCGALFADAQTITDDEDVQSWNDVQLTIPINKEFDFYTSLTLRLGKNITRLNDGRYAVGVVYHPNKFWSFQPFYWFINARNARGQFKAEHRARDVSFSDEKFRTFAPQRVRIPHQTAAQFVSLATVADI
jgi:hypothetical protein